jgi:ABC-2 type transport system permease protein
MTAGADAARPAAAGAGAGRAGAGAATLTPVFVRLKLALLRNGLRQSSRRTAAYLITMVIVLLMSALVLVGFSALRAVHDASSVVVPSVLVLAIGWAVMPLFFPTGDETLDTGRLVMLPLRPRPLIRALLVSSLVGLGPLFTLCLLVGAAVASARGAGGAVVAVVGVVLALLTCVALARAVAATNTRLLTSRRGRDLAVLSGLVIAVGIQVVNLGVQRLDKSGHLSALDPTAHVVRWIPPASAIGAVSSAGEGSYGAAVAQLALAAVFLAALLLVWQRSVVKLMTAPDSSTLTAAGTRRRASGPGRHGIVALLPEGRTATVMQRTLRYAWRNPKTKAAWVTSMAIGLIVPVFNALEGASTIYFACFASGLIGTQMYNQFGQDGSAFWMVAMTISSKRDAYLELRARLLALLVAALPYSAAVCVLMAALTHEWGRLAQVLGLSWAVLGALLATGAVASARLAYSIPQEVRKNVAPGQTGLASLSVLGGMLSAVVLCAPMIALVLWLRLSSQEGISWLALPAGAVYGTALTLIGLRLAARPVADRLPEILEAVSKA